MTKAIIILVAVVACGAAAIAPCHGEEYQPANENERVFEGKVVGVDVGQSTLTVSDAVQIVFPISSKTKFVQDVYDIKLSDIEVGDYVSVEYVRSGDESRVPLKVTMVTLRYDDSKARK